MKDKRKLSLPFVNLTSKRLQFQLISKNFICLCQLGSLKQCSTMDVGVVLMYLIHTGQVKNLLTSTLTFDITQFFPSLNHQLLSLILDKAEFDFKILLFFCDYLVERKIKYLWNNFLSSSFNVDIGVGQGSVFSHILSALYFSSLLHIFEKRLKNTKILISLISFVDNGLFISQNKSLVVSNSHLFCNYHIISFFLGQFGLIVEHGKMEVFHFSRSYGLFNPSSLDLTILGGPILCSKKTWYYLEFIFNKKLTF